MLLSLEIASFSYPLDFVHMVLDTEISYFLDTRNVSGDRIHSKDMGDVKGAFKSECFYISQTIQVATIENITTSTLSGSY